MDTRPVDARREQGVEGKGADHDQAEHHRGLRAVARRARMLRLLGRRRLEVRRHARAMLAAAAGTLRAPRAAILASRSRTSRGTRGASPRPSRRPLRRAAVGVRTRDWAPHSRLFVLGDTFGWALDDEAAYVSGVAGRAGYQLGPPGWARYAREPGRLPHESLRSARPALDPLISPARRSRTSTAARARRATPSSTAAFAALERDPARFDRVQVTHREMEEIVVSAGVAPANVHRIPIGIELDRFPLGDDARRRAARGALGLPQDAFVVGSFQKDGVGFEDGLEPKSIKGPDVLVEALEAARRELDDLVVLLTGPARGYVRRELERRSVPHVHRLLPTRDELTTAYHALDAYVVASRQEGGPKSILESMATGVPLVTTRAGQAPDLVVDGENGILVDVEDAEAIAAALVRIHRDTRARDDAPRGRAADGEPRTPTSASRRAGRRCSTGSRSDPVDSERVARYGRAATRWGKLAGRRPCTTRAPRVLRLGPDPRARRAGRGRHREAAEARRALAQPPHGLLAPLPRHDVPAARPATAALARARSAARGSSSTRTASPTRAGRASGQTSSTRRSAARCSRPTTSSTRARSASAPRTSSSVSRADRGRSSRTRSTSSGSRLAHRRSTARSCCSAATRRRPTGSSSRLETFRHVARRAPDRAPARQRSARLRSGADTAPPRAPRRSRLPRRVHAGRRTRRLPPRARPAPHEGQRSVPDDGDRGDGMRRARSRTRRAAGQRSSSGTRRASASRTTTASTVTSRPRRRRSPPPCPGCSPSASGSQRPRGARAVERFALTDWLDRHAAIFAELVGQEEGAPR